MNEYGLTFVDWLHAARRSDLRAVGSKRLHAAWRAGEDPSEYRANAPKRRSGRSGGGVRASLLGHFYIVTDMSGKRAYGRFSTLTAAKEKAYELQRPASFRKKWIEREEAYSGGHRFRRWYNQDVDYMITLTK